MLEFKELAEKLRSAYLNAPKGEQKAQIMLCIIKYAEDIRHCGISTQELRDEAFKGLGLKKATYVTEINTAKHLAKYVVAEKD